MVKITYSLATDPDDPIYKEGFLIFSPRSIRAPGPSQTEAQDAKAGQQVAVEPVPEADKDTAAGSPEIAGSVRGRKKRSPRGGTKRPRR